MFKSKFKSNVMDPELKQKWIDALLSGHYHQGNGSLRNANDEFCCLGVLADLVEPDGWEAIPSVITPGTCGYEFRGEPNCEFLPEDLAKALGLTRAKQEWLAAMNDGGTWHDADTLEGHDENKLSFEQIAARIQKEL
jgi:hypothetical protein